MPWSNMRLWPMAHRDREVPVIFPIFAALIVIGCIGTVAFIALGW